MQRLCRRRLDSSAFLDVENNLSISVSNYVALSPLVDNHADSIDFSSIDDVCMGHGRYTSSLRCYISSMPFPWAVESRQ